MPGAPTAHELVVVGLLGVGGTMLLLIALRLVTSYFRGWWSGPFGPEHWRAGGASVSAAAGAGLLWLLWRDLDHIATRMGVGVLVLVALLASELEDLGVGRRRRSR
jgi:hypothetical protein